MIRHYLIRIKEAVRQVEKHRFEDAQAYAYFDTQF